jgi:hypothetical protein
LEYGSADSAEKVISYYKEQLKKYGNVLVCRTDHFDVDAEIHNKKDSGKDLTCGGKSGANVELKVGTNENQHLVAVEPEGKGSKFSLVYVRTHGKEADI